MNYAEATLKGPKNRKHHHIIDELLEERSIALRKIPFLWPLVIKWCLPFFRYQQAVDWVDRLAPLEGHEALRQFSVFLDLQSSIRGIEHVPSEGPLIIAANHPTGFVDAFAIHAAISQIRSDLVFFSNRDVLRIVPNTCDILIPVEWLHKRRTAQAMRDTLSSAHAAIAAQRAIVMFPGGGIARGSLSGLKEMDWLSTTAKLAKRFGVPILPLHINTRNSMLYYMFEAIHDELRDLLRFREVLSKVGQRYQITAGSIIQPDELPSSADVATAALYFHVLQGVPNERPWK